MTKLIARRKLFGSIERDNWGTFAKQIQQNVRQVLLISWRIMQCCFARQKRHVEINLFVNKFARKRENDCVRITIVRGRINNYRAQWTFCYKYAGPLIIASKNKGVGETFIRLQFLRATFVIRVFPPSEDTLLIRFIELIATYRYQPPFYRANKRGQKRKKRDTRERMKKNALSRIWKQRVNSLNS